MPNYVVRYKVENDRDSRRWPVGRYADKETALAWFNTGTARDEQLGQFEFDPDGFAATDFYLVEDHQHFFHLKKIPAKIT
jgi:hypothetical protein